MNQLKAGAILNYVIIGLHTLVGLLYTPYMLHMLGQNEFGLYSLVASVISYLTILDFGFGNALVRYTAKFRAEDKTQEQYEMFGMFMLLYLFLGLLVILIGMALYSNIDALFGDTMSLQELQKARIMMLLLVFNIGFSFPMGIWGSIITAYERFVFPRVINIARIILNTVVMICLLNLGYKAVAVVVVQTLFNIITLLLNCIYCKKYLHVRLYFRNFKWDFFKEVGIYSFWIFLNIIMDRIYWSTGQFVLGATVGTVAVAVFAVAISLQSMYMQFSTAISGVFLPKVTAMITAGNNNDEVSSLFIRTGRIQFAIMAFILCGFIVLGERFIILWAGIEYRDAYIISIMFFSSLLIPLIQNLGITILQARNQMKFRSILYIVIALASLVFQIILAKKFGGIGCAIAISCALLLGQGLIMNIYYSKIQGIKIKLFWREIVRMSIAPFLVTVSFLSVLRYCYHIESWSQWAVAALVFCSVYVPLFWLFSMNSYERELIKAPFMKILKITFGNRI